MATADAAIAPENTLIEIMDEVRDVKGWMSPGQAAMLHDRAAALGPGARIVEIGSYQGRSAIVLARSATEGVEIFAIDPHGGDNRGPHEVTGPAAEGEADHQAFLANLERAGVADRVRHIRKLSSDAHDDVEGAVDLLYIDGAHQYAPARDDIRDWGARVPVGGTMLIHDAWASVGVTLAQLRLLAGSRQWRYAGRSETMVEYRREATSRRESLRTHLRELKVFNRYALAKVAFLTRQWWILDALKHPRRWPY